KKEKSKKEKQLTNEAENFTRLALSILYFRLRANGLHHVSFFEEGAHYDNDRMRCPDADFDDENDHPEQIAICSFPLISTISQNGTRSILNKADVVPQQHSEDTGSSIDKISETSDKSVHYEKDL